jgi:heptosyltransferase III
VRLLFVKPKHIGDGLMLTPTLAAVRAAYPDAEIWVVVRKGCDGILKGCSAIDRIFTIAAPFGEKRGRLNWWSELKVITRLRFTRFDYIFELGDGHRARWFSLMIGGRNLYSVQTASPLNAFWRWRFSGISTFAWKHRHRVEKDFHSVSEFLKLPETIPGLVFERALTQEWPPGADLKDFAVMHPGTRESVKRWPREHWLEVGRYLLSRFKQVVISCGPASYEVADAEWLQQQLGPRVLSTAGKSNWAQLAGLLYRAKFFVGVDTAAMHLAAACQCPIVALFGPSFEENWRPWQVPHKIVTVPGFVHEKGNPNYQHLLWLRKIVEIKAADVICACEEVIKSPRNLPP